MCVDTRGLSNSAWLGWQIADQQDRQVASAAEPSIIAVHI